MNIFTEIKRRVTGSMRRYLESPADRRRPQDDAPDEQVTLRVVADYQRMYRERQAVVGYIRHLEKIYKDAQTTIYQTVMPSSPPTRRRIIENLKILLFDITEHHLEAQKLLRKELGMTEKDEEEKNGQTNGNDTNETD